MPSLPAAECSAPGDTLRAVLGDAVQRSTAVDGFVIHMDPARWNEVHALDERDSDAGRVSLSADQQRELRDLFDTEINRTSANTELTATSSGPSQLQRASELRGKTIQSGEQNLDNIEEIAIDLEPGTVMALVDPRRRFHRCRRRVSLSRTDFESAQSSSRNLASANVQVMPESGKLGLRGAIRDGSEDEHRTRSSRRSHRRHNQKPKSPSAAGNG